MRQNIRRKIKRKCGYEYEYKLKIGDWVTVNWMAENSGNDQRTIRNRLIKHSPEEAMSMPSRFYRPTVKKKNQGKKDIVLSCDRRNVCVPVGDKPCINYARCWTNHCRDVTHAKCLGYSFEKKVRKYDHRQAINPCDSY